MHRDEIIHCWKGWK